MSVVNYKKLKNNIELYDAASVPDEVKQAANQGNPFPFKLDIDQCRKLNSENDTVQMEENIAKISVERDINGQKQTVHYGGKVLLSVNHPNRDYIVLYCPPGRIRIPTTGGTFVNPPIENTTCLIDILKKFGSDNKI